MKKNLRIKILIASVMLLSALVVFYTFSEFNRSYVYGKPTRAGSRSIGDAVPNEYVAKKIADAIVEHYFEIFEKEKRERGECNSSEGSLDFSDFTHLVVFDKRLNEWIVYYWYVTPEPALGGRNMAISIRRNNGLVTRFDFGIGVGDFPGIHTEEFVEKWEEITDRVRRERFQ